MMPGTLADGRVFYAMKFVEGERLDALAKRMENLFRIACAFFNASAKRLPSRTREEFCIAI